MEKLKKGFYTALGTPLDENGNIIADSLVKEINIQIEAGASGLLLMGSMGIQASIKSSAYKEAVKIASEACGGRVPLFVGAMDNSIRRVMERIDMIRDYSFDAIVLTTPYYSVSPSDVLCNFFEKIADYSPKPVFLYDLAVVTKQKITYPMLERLSKHPNIKGIKSGDLVLARTVKLKLPDFEFLYSNIDTFDIALSYGIDKVLDGMFASTPKNANALINAAWKGDTVACSSHLDAILSLRDFWISTGHLMVAFSESMNLLGMRGFFAFDYEDEPIRDEEKGKIKARLTDIGEL